MKLINGIKEYLIDECITRPRTSHFATPFFFMLVAAVSLLTTMTFTTSAYAQNSNIGFEKSINVLAAIPQQVQFEIPGIVPPPSSTPQVFLSGFVANGTINSIIYTPKTAWIASGNWSMIADNDHIKSFKTNMTWYNDNGTSSHTHHIENIRPSTGVKVALDPNNTMLLKAVSDVGTNGRIVWKNVPTMVDIKAGKTLTISLADADTNHHFAAQRIFGLVSSLKRCSDVPGPDMEVLPFERCTSP